MVKDGACSCQGGAEAPEVSHSGAETVSEGPYSNPQHLGGTWEWDSARRQCWAVYSGAWLEGKRQQTSVENTGLTECQKTFFSPWQQSSSGTDFVFPTLRGVQNLTGWNPELPEQLTLLWVGDGNRHCSRSLPAWMILWSCDFITSNKSDLHVLICKKIELESTLISKLPVGS